MVAICPCCHQTVNASDLLVSTDTLIATRGEKQARLTASEARILHELKIASPKSVTHHDLSWALYGYDREPEHPMHSIYLIICRLRTKVWSMGVRVRAVKDVGYRIEIV